MKKKLLAAVLCLVMALSLFVPALGATALGEETEREEVPVMETTHAHTHAVAERPAVTDAQQAELLATCCSATTPHEEGATILCSSAATEHYCVASTGSYVKVTLKLEGDYASLKASGKTNLSNDSVNPPTLGYKHKVAAGGTATVTLSNNSVITLHMVDPNACDHTYDNGEVTKAATCTADGVKTFTCSKCGGTKTEAIPALGHTWNAGTVTKAATCTEPGVKTFTCSVCSSTKTEVIDPAHKFGSDGVCTVCNQHQHKWDNGTVTTAATCGEEGEKTFHCTVSGCTETDTQPIPATGKHNFVSGVCSVCSARETTGFLTAAGDLESAYATWPIGAGVTKYEAWVIDASGKETKVDAQLIREYSGYMRVDALGLKAGKYTIKVKDNNGKEMTTDPLTVKAHDRSGFAFVNNTTTPGAYNADGTLKSGAKVVYVTTNDELEALLSAKDSIWNGKAETTTCVRIIGKVSASDVLGFQDWKCGLTVEGVGNDATLTGGGVFVKGSSNVEVRNLAVFHVHSGGKNDLIAIEQKNDHIWVHNCDLYYGFSGGGDQAKGDGSLDVKDTNYSTFSYNHFWDSGKCSLLGNSSSEDYITYHHNWFDHSDSRHPRIRGGVNGGNVHIYNNYYDGVSKYGVGTTSGSETSRASVFIEANYFRNTKYPIMNSKQASDSNGKGGSNTFSGDNPGFNKVWNNVMVGSKNFVSQLDNPDSFDGYVVSSRSEKVPSTVNAGGSVYNNFDTSIDLGVTASQIESPADARLTVTQWAGRVQGGDLVYEFDNDTQDTNYSVISELDDMLTNYKTKLVSIGGTVTKPVSGSTPTEHTHTPGTWTIVTVPGCDPQTQEVVNGQETQSCTICGQVITTRSVAGAHSNDGSGKCTVCGKTVANNEGPGASTSSGPTLQAKNFKMTAASQNSTSKNQEDLLASEIAGVADGYFSLTPGAKSVYKRTKDATTAGAATEWIQLPKEGTGGIQFTVTNAPATLKVKFSSSSADDDKKTAAIQVKDASGKAVADKDGKTPSVTKKTSKESNAITVTFENLAAGTYQILGAPSSGATPQTARVYSVTVVEAEATCEHAATTHHPAVPATCVEDGNIEYWTCDTCKKNFSDEACTKAVDDVAIEATGEHTWSEWSEADANGEQSRYCEVCGEEETRLGGNLGVEGNQVTWALDDAGKLTITNTDNHIGQDDMVLVALWGDNNKFQGVKLIKASQLTATVGRSWDHLKLIWVDSKYAPKCDAKAVSAID